MHVYLIRHGKAERDSDTGQDRDRPLAPRGRQQAEFLAQALASAEHTPRRIIHSGYLRAEQTASPIARALNLDTLIQPGITPDDPPSSVPEAIRQHDDTDVLAIVAHNPILSSAASLLLGGIGAPAISMRTGACIHLELDPAEPIGSATVLNQLRSPE